MARRWPWALWDDAMSMIAQGNPAVGKAAVEFLSRHPKECAVAESDRQDGQGRILVQTLFFLTGVAGGNIG